MMNTKHTIRRAFLLGAASLTLSACGGLIGPPEAGHIYLMRPGFPPATAAQKVGWGLSIQRPNAPGVLNNDRIALIQPDGTMDYYANATYPDPLPQLVQRALLDSFQSSGRIDAVAREQDALHSDYSLVTEIQDFQARYSAPDGIPEVTVTLVAKLATTRGRKIVGNLTAAQTATATVNSTAAVTQALSAALGAAASQVVAWAIAFPPPPDMVPLQASGRSPQGPQGRQSGQLLQDVTRGSDSLPNPPK